MKIVCNIVPFENSPEVEVLVLLDEFDVKRLQEHESRSGMAVLKNAPAVSFVIASATAEQLQEIARMQIADLDWKQKALQMVTRKKE